MRYNSNGKILAKIVVESKYHETIFQNDLSYFA